MMSAALPCSVALTAARSLNARIDGFEAAGRTFGGATCHPARMNGRDCHLIRPDRSHYKDVVEFIAPERLRDALRLEDGVTVRIDFEEP